MWHGLEKRMKRRMREGSFEPTRFSRDREKPVLAIPFATRREVRWSFFDGDGSGSGRKAGGKINC